MFALGSFKTFISNSREDSVARNQMETKTRLAIAALLVRVATIDSDMSEVRAKELHRILKSRFRLDDSSATQLIEDACASADRYAHEAAIHMVMVEDGVFGVVATASAVLAALRKA